MYETKNCPIFRFAKQTFSVTLRWVPCDGLASYSGESSNAPLLSYEACEIVGNFYRVTVLRISGYSGFLRNLPTNTTTFLRGLRLCGKSRS